MNKLIESSTLLALRQGIARQECGTAPAVARGFATGHADLDAALAGGLGAGRLHELFAVGIEDGPSAAGFAAMLALRAQAGAGGLLWLRTEAAEQRTGRLYMPGLAELGADPAALLQALLPDDRSLLRTAADAGACTGLSGLVVECWGKAPLLDLTTSRRLALVAEESGVTIFLLRIDAVPVPSAAATRWGVAAAPSQMLAPDAPGHMMIEVELLRRRGGPAGMRWQMEWNRDERTFRKPALPCAMVPLARHRPADPYRDARRSA